MNDLIFHVFAALITVCSIMVVASRNAVTSAIFLVVDMFVLAGVYAMMEAHFVAVIQVLIYAGAIVVLFMFVIMLLNLAPEERRSLKLAPSDLLILLATLVAFAVVILMILFEQPAAPLGELTPEAIAAAGGNTYVVGMLLFTKYLWPFELASVLILLAVVAAVVIAKKDRSHSPKELDATAAKRRALSGTR